MFKKKINKRKNFLQQQMKTVSNDIQSGSFKSFDMEHI